MREMKDSGVEWIGEIPSNWGILPLSRILAEHSRKNIGNSEQNVLSLSYGNIIRRDVTDNMGLIPESFETYNIIEPGHIVLRLTDLQNDQRSLRTGLVKERGIITSAYLTLTSKLEIDSRYYHYLLHTYDVMKIIYNMGNGVRQNLKFSELAKLPLPIPVIEEQHRIANYLDTKCAQIDRAIARQQEVIEKLKEYKLSVITEAVTKGLNPDVPMKDSGIEWIGEIPEEWVLMKLRFAVENIGDIDHYMPASVDIGIPYVMTGDLHDLASAINFQECKMVSTEDYVELSSKIAIQKGDLLFARYATIGTICYVDLDREFLVSYSCVIIKPNEDLMLGKFLYYVMKSNTFAEEVKQYTNSNTQGNVGIEALYRSKVVVPSVLQQKEIIGFLEDKCTLVDKSIVSKMGLVNKLEEYKKSLIYEVVTGKREV